MFLNIVNLTSYGLILLDLKFGPNGIRLLFIYNHKVAHDRQGRDDPIVTMFSMMLKVYILLEEYSKLDFLMIQTLPSDK